MSNSLTEVCVIPLTRGKVAKVDAEDFALVSSYMWFALYASGYWYAARNRRISEAGPRGLILMHRFLLQPAKGLEVHHKNDDGLDNRRDNLSALTYVEHQATKPIPEVGATGYRGVTRTRGGRYMSRVNVLQRCVWCETFDTALAAARAYDRTAFRVHGAHAHLNFPGEVPCPTH